MFFDKHEFKSFFDPRSNLLNPDFRRPSLFDIFYIPIWFIVFGWLMLIIATTSSVKFNWEN